MQTKHEIIIGNSQSLSTIPNNSIALVVTSPPYPMIEMWDELFIKQNSDIKRALIQGKGQKAFALMHQQLDPVWRELFRVLKQGGFVCINIGDATRTVGDKFQLYANHAQIQQRFSEIGFDVLPLILWWKPTNAPNKFMGSGMLAAGAFVTLEHEYILIFRKNNKREFKNQKDKARRRQSAFFWEERNIWFSDFWRLSGVTQDLVSNKARKRSASFPFELAYRLINMYSVHGDTVLDPFLGIGTTMFAAIACMRNSIGIEIEPGLLSIIDKQVQNILPRLNSYIKQRIKNHQLFVDEHKAKGGVLKYKNIHHNFPVKTKQEVELKISYLERIEKTSQKSFTAYYQKEACIDKPLFIYSEQKGFF